MSRIVPIASGKGGVGKSVLAANLGLALARQGKTVLLVDLDLGGSNLHTCLGIKNRHPGLGALVYRKEKGLAGLLVETGEERLWLLPGDGLLPGTANLEWFAKKRILKELSELPADFILLDLGAGTSYNVVDFFLSSDRGLVVALPEITSILNAYSLLKTSAYRLLLRAFPEESEERAQVQAFAGDKTEGSGKSFLELARELALASPERGGAALARLESLRPRLVMNRAKAAEDAGLGYRLKEISGKNLGFDLEFLGFLLEDEGVGASVAARRPLLALDPLAPFSRGVTALAARIAASPEEGPAREVGEGAPLEQLDLAGEAARPGQGGAGRSRDRAASPFSPA